MTMHRLHLATQAQQIRDTLPPVTDGSEAVAVMFGYLRCLQDVINGADNFSAHQFALKIAADALRLAEWAEGND